MGVEKHAPIVEPRTVASYVSSTPEEKLSETVSQSHLNCASCSCYALGFKKRRRPGKQENVAKSIGFLLGIYGFSRFR